MSQNWRKIFIIVVSLGTVGALIAVWAGSSHKGSITTHVQKSTDTTVLGKKLDGSYFSLMYRNGYAKRVLPVTDNNIELYELTADTVYDKRLSVEITHLRSGVLSDDGSYNLRRVHPEDYQERLLKTNNAEAHIMVKANGKEQTAFFAHNGMLATLAFVTDGASDKLPAEVDGVVSSFQWKP